MTTDNTAAENAPEVVAEEAKGIAILNEEDHVSLKESITAINGYMDERPAESLVGVSEQEKDTHYSVLTELWNTYRDKLQKARFRLPLAQGEFFFIKNTIEGKIEYTDTTVFLGKRVQKEFLDKAPKYGNHYDTIVHDVTPDVMVLIYHLLSSHKVLGLTQQANYFASVIEKLGAVSQAYAEYDTLSKQLSDRVKDWTVGFSTEPVTESIQATTIEPSSESTEG